MKFEYLPLILVTTFIYFVTKFPLTYEFTIQLAIIFFIICLVVSFILIKKGFKLSQNRVFIYLVTVTLLLLVGSTGFLISPFFVLLYAWIFVINYSLGRKFALVFCTNLVLLFLLSLGSINTIFELLTIVSFISAIPVIGFLEIKR